MPEPHRSEGPMKPSGECRTPGARFRIGVHNDRIEVAVRMPRPISLPGATAARLESDIHDALERVLAPYIGTSE